MGDPADGVGDEVQPPATGAESETDPAGALPVPTDEVAAPGVPEEETPTGDVAAEVAPADESSTGDVAVDGTPTEGAAPGVPEGEGAASGGPVASGGWGGEVLLALEVAALVAFAVTRPVLDSFGRSPETFVARRATSADIVLFGVLVAFVPALVVAVLGALTRLLGPTVRGRVHLGLITVLGGVAAWRLVQDATGWPGGAKKLLLAGVVAALALGLVRWRAPASATFLRYAGVASVIFLIQFLVLSPVTDLAFGGGRGVDDAVAAGVRRDLADADADAGNGNGTGGAPPPVVVVVMDAFPTATLLDGSGHIDADAFPSLAALAGSATWYRNASSVSAFTTEAVPAVFTGRFPRSDGSSAGDGGDPENLFTLLGGTYDLHVREQVTSLCPSKLCPPRGSSDLAGLLGDAERLWWDHTSAAADDPDDLAMNMPGVTDVDRYGELDDWIDAQDLTPGGRPDLFAAHLLLPHNPWDTLPDGTRYQASAPETGTFAAYWSDSGLAVGHQRHVLQAQAADRLIGHLTDRLREAGIYDDALIVVTADHGHAFVPDEPERGVSEAQYEQILWAPLVVKAPGQTDGDGTIDDSNVMSIDVLPTIADLLGVDLPWKVDGVPARQAGDRDPAVKWFDDDPANRLRSGDADGGRVAVDAQAGFRKLLTMDGIPATGPDAVWKRTPYGDLFGREVDALDVGRPSDATVHLADPPTGLAGDDDIDLDDRLPLEVVGETELPLDTVVAYALNGKIGAVTTVEPPHADLTSFAHGLLPPDLFVEGHNDLTAYVVDGPPAHPTLRPLAVS
ncbi:MAG TPA: sulfatase-like hydrolase/transferase [Acidimicrobiales bacterium]|nr:sulfatase-like hydrolase/transferase [Acidimicrobiales bacterium]